MWVDVLTIFSSLLSRSITTRSSLITSLALKDLIEHSLYIYLIIFDMHYAPIIHQFFFPKIASLHDMKNVLKKVFFTRW